MPGQVSGQKVVSEVLPAGDFWIAESVSVMAGGNKAVGSNRARQQPVTRAAGCAAGNGEAGRKAVVFIKRDRGNYAGFPNRWYQGIWQEFWLSRDGTAPNSPAG